MPTITKLTVASGRTYQVVPDLQLRQPVYTDRAYVVTAIPASLLGATYLCTANDDKFSPDLADFLAFEVSEPVTICVCRDVRQTERPFWMSLFHDTGEDLVTSDARLRAFRRTYPTGAVSLGGNQGGVAGSMYVVTVQPSIAVPPPVDATPDARWAQTVDEPGYAEFVNQHNTTQKVTIDTRRHP